MKICQTQQNQRIPVIWKEYEVKMWNKICGCRRKLSFLDGNI